MLTGRWTAPVEGDIITTPDGQQHAWQTAIVNDQGWLNERALRGGYALWTCEVPRDGVMILAAQGPSATCVNGVWRVGDVYQTGWTQIPIPLREGANEILFHVARGGLRAALRQPTGDIEFNRSEVTLPTLVDDEPFDTFGSIVLINASNEWTHDLTMHVDSESLHMHTQRAIPDMPPCSIRKVQFDLTGDATSGPNSHELLLSVKNPSQDVLATQSLPIRVVTTNDVIVRTFISDIDGSVQYYGLRLAKSADDDDAQEAKGLILSLHGASVEAAHQASCYAPKSWAHLVTPTNRRPFGFDWEDWGRLDALEVLDLALDSLNADPKRVAVTGHSMGGHGTWHLAVNDPEKFVAAAPSAGWVSFWSYAGAAAFESQDPIDAMLRRATLPSQTLEYIHNLSDLGVYVLHGDADDNVPVEQARIMRSALAEFHTDFAYHEEPGAGHWWGNQCMDYPPLMAFIHERMKRGKLESDDQDVSPTPLRSERAGPFKDAFRHRMLFVVGTNGSPDENISLLNKARYDAETFWYRGNGSIDLVLDTDFEPGAEPDRNVILYGNADTNLAWNALLADSPVQVRKTSISVGERTINASDLACIMIRPRPGSSIASVGVIAGTSARGFQAAMRLPVFVSGVAYPDLMIWSADALETGKDAILMTGFFGSDWSLEQGDFAWASE